MPCATRVVPCEVKDVDASQPGPDRVAQGSAGASPVTPTCADKPGHDAEESNRRFIPNHGPQQRAWDSAADELFYGGGAGGGKSALAVRARDRGASPRHHLPARISASPRPGGRGRAHPRHPRRLQRRHPDLEIARWPPAGIRLGPAREGQGALSGPRARSQGLRRDHPFQRKPVSLPDRLEPLAPAKPSAAAWW